MPKRSPPPIRSTSEPSRSSHSSGSKGALGGSPMGAFWSTEHANDSLFKEDKGAPKFDSEPTTLRMIEINLRNPLCLENPPLPEGKTRSLLSVSRIDFSRGTERSKETKLSGTATSENEAFSSFVAEFDTSKLNNGVKLGKGGSLDVEIESFREQLKQANMEKAEITSKCEKLAGICRSQRQEIQVLKQALAARTPSPNKEYLKNQSSNQQSGRSERSLFNPEPKPWQAFAEDTKSPISSTSVRTRNGQAAKPDGSSSSSNHVWGFGNESFSAVPTSGHRVSRSRGEGNNSQCFRDSKLASQPAGWAGF